MLHQMVPARCRFPEQRRHQIETVRSVRFPQLLTCQCRKRRQKIDLANQRLGVALRNTLRPTHDNSGVPVGAAKTGVLVGDGSCSGPTDLLIILAQNEVPSHTERQHV